MKNTFVKVLSFVMALMMVVGTFGTLAVFAADEVACKHEKGTLVEKKAPTCKDIGYSSYICSLCGEEWVTDVVLPDEKYHEYVEAPAVEASCLTNAWTAGIACKYCGEGIGEGKAPEELKGTQKKHSFRKEKVEATCDENAKFVSTCQLCGKTAEWLNGDNDDKKNYFTEDQKYSDWAVVVLTGEGNEALNKGHNDLNWVVESVPVSADGKCVDGLAVGTCKFCDYKETAAIKNQHKLDKKLNENGLPCIGWEKGALQCSVCGYIEGKAVDTSKVGHTPEYTWSGKFDKTNLPYKGATETESVKGERFTIAELEAFGYKNGESFATAATCTKAGRELVRCVCGEIYVNDIPATGHKYADWNSIATVWPTDCTVAATKTRYCTVCTKNSDDWKASKEVKEIAPAAATAHNYVKTDASVPATCTEVGINYFTCNNKYTTVVNGVAVEKTCGKAGETTYDEALGHAWGEAAYKSGNCEGNDLVWARQCATCKVFDTNVTIPDAAKKHAFGAEEEVVATCMKENYKTQTCSVCKYVKEIKVEGAEKNPANHVYPEGDELLKAGAHVEFVTGMEPKCNKPGQAIVTCKNGCKGTDKQVATGTTAHDLTGDYKKTSGSTTTVEDIADLTEGYELGKLGNEENVRYVPATCTSVGYWNNGKICMVCGHVDTPATEIEKDPENHSGSMSKREDGHVNATCMEPAYDMYNTSCCGLVKVYVDNEKADCSFVTVLFEAPDCVNDGNHEYQKCQWCGTKKVFSTTANGCVGNCGINHETLGVNDNHVIPALGHNYDEKNSAGVELAKVAGYRETCQETGIRDYYGCLNCYSKNEVNVLVEGENVLLTIYSGYAKLGDKEYNLDDDDDRAAFLTAITIAPHYRTKAVEKTPVAATCATDGVAAREAGYLAENTWCTVCDVNADGVGNWVISKTTVKHTTVTFKAGYDNETGKVVDCTKPTCVITSCTKCDWTDTVLTPGAEKHNLPDEYVEVAPDASKGQYICNTDTYKIKTCADCMYDDKDIVSEKIGCYTTKGVPGGEKFFFDFACNKIAEYIDHKCDLCGKTVTWNDIDHAEVTAEAPETCVSLGYKITYCALCDYTDNDTTHDYERKTEVVDDEIKGINGHTREGAVVLELVEALPGVDGYVRYICSECQETVEEVLKADVALNTVISADSEIVAAGSEIKVDVKVSTNAPAFTQLFFVVDAADFELVDVELVAEFADANVHADLYKNESDVGFVLYTENNAAGETVYATLTGENVALVTLTLAVKQYATAGNIAVSAQYAVIGYEENGAEKNATFADNGKALTLKIAQTGDLNADGIIGVVDLQALIPQITKLVATGSYDAVADVNKDGTVDQFDIAALRQFMKNGFTTAAYLEMIGEDVDAAIAALKITDVADSIRFAKFVDDKLADKYETFLETRSTLNEYIADLYLEYATPASEQAA